MYMYVCMCVYRCGRVCLYVCIYVCTLMCACITQTDSRATTTFSPTHQHQPHVQGGKREENIALLLSIQQALREAGQLKSPRLRFEPAVPESVRQVRVYRYR